MTDINDHLARIEEALPGADLEAHRALARVKDETRQLRDGLRKCIQAIEDAYGGWEFVPEESFEREAVDEARAFLHEDEGGGREPDGYRIDGGRVIPTDR